jgi:phosphoribosyl 1,2-cyclic phosphate phosphodiesterase
VKIRVLGCGTSSGVPRIGNDWGQCDPAEPRNRRLRSSVLVESAGKRLLVDCGPDLREQLLAADVGTVDAVIVTHDHADHCHGIDELRTLAQNSGKPVPIYARADVLARLQDRFTYIFKTVSIYRQAARPVELGPELAFGAMRIGFVDQPHGGMSSLGIRFDEGARSAVYAIDYNDMTDDMRRLYEGAELWISDCLSRRPHPTHAHLDAVLAWARELGIGRLFLSHLNNKMDYRTLVGELPEWAAPAHDGLEVVF